MKPSNLFRNASWKDSNIIAQLKRHQSLILVAVVIIAIVTSCGPDSGSSMGASPALFTADIPVDVDPALQQELKRAGKYYELNEAFNKYSWQALLAIQWPRDGQGNPLPNFTDPGTPTWLGWKEAFQVYRADGKVPAPWGSPRTATGLGLSGDVLSDDARVVLSSSTPTHPDNFNIADEVDQAFAGKLFDQNGNVVVYEVLMNEEEFDYVVTNKLYNINGQIEFSKSNNNLANFPKGNYSTGALGAVEIKLAWKILETSDIKERYFSDEGYIEVNGQLVKKDLGMIGMHISQKTPTGKQWVWSTFEHIDNLRENVIETSGNTERIPPSLMDPDCEICPINVDVTNGSSFSYQEDEHGPYWLVKTATGGAPCTTSQDSVSSKYYAGSHTMKTQVKRMIDIPVRVQRINAAMQEYFKSQNSVWQYYELIDTQFPRDQDKAPAPHLASNYVLPQSVINKPGGDPNIPLLTNLTMETYFQLGNQNPSNLMEANPTSENQTIFGTESCMGCHSSAPIIIGMEKNCNGSLVGVQGTQLSGDFSWLLTKANWDKTLPPYKQ